MVQRCWCRPEYCWLFGQNWRRFLANGFGDQSFMPHGMCYLWVPQLYWMHVSSDFLIGVSYLAISSTLIYLIYRAREDMPFSWIFVAFGVFIACLRRHSFHERVDSLESGVLARWLC